MYVACIYSCIVFMYCINVCGCTLAIVLYVVFVIGMQGRTALADCQINNQSINHIIRIFR